MADKPRCEAVVRPGQRGVRVYPKGCKVRRKVVGGAIRKVSRNTGQLKPKKVKLKTTGKEINVHVRLNGGAYEEFNYDTGAMDSGCNYRVARALGLVDGNNKPYDHHQTENIQVGGHIEGSTVPAIRFFNIPLFLRETGRESTGILDVMANAGALFGTGHIKGQRKFLKVKFAPAKPIVIDL